MKLTFNIISVCKSTEKPREHMDVYFYSFYYLLDNSDLKNDRKDLSKNINWRYR